MFYIVIYYIVSTISYARSQTCNSDYYLRYVSLSVCPPAWNNSTSSRRIFMKYGICGFFEILSRKFKFD
jgi:hypothetical protein